MQEIEGKQEANARSKDWSSVTGGPKKKACGEPPRLIVLCGPSHAGKSTFARKLPGSFTIVSSDQIRKRLTGSSQVSEREARVWTVFESRKRGALKKGRNVILDACHISKRARWHALQGLNTHHKKICVVFDLPFRVIRERCLKEKRMPLKEAGRMWKAFQNSKPTRNELKLQGFDEVCFVGAASGEHTDRAPWPRL